MNPRHLSFAILLVSVSTTLAQTDNETLGDNAGASITTGDRNVLLGDFAGTNLTASSDNLMIGNYTGFLVNNGSSSAAARNVFMGFRAGGGYTHDEWTSYQNDPGANPLPDLGGTLQDGDDNVFLGYRAGLRNLTGSDGVFIGSEAGMNNSAGFDNTFVGHTAGKDNTTGSGGTFLGYQAGERNIDGDHNVFIGGYAGQRNTSGEENVAIGHGSLQLNTTGWGNTALGEDAAWENTTGIKNTAIGEEAGYKFDSGNFNTAIGIGAGNKSDNVDYNTFLGALAGNRNGVGSEGGNATRNTFFGVGAGLSNQSGSNNVAIGAFADTGSLSGTQDGIITSFSANPINTTDHPGDVVRDVSGSVNIGHRGDVRADDAIGVGQYVTSSAEDGIALGAGAGNSYRNSITIGNSSRNHAVDTVVIGQRNVPYAWHPAVDGVTDLGAQDRRFTTVHSRHLDVTGDGDGEVYLWPDGGNVITDGWLLRCVDGGDFEFIQGTQQLRVGNDGRVTSRGNVHVNSDRRLKEDIRPIENALSILGKVEGKTYRWKQELGRDERLHYGLIAQEVEAAIPELVSTNPSDDIKSVNYQGFVPILINGVKELSEQGTQLDQDLAQLHKELAAQQEVLDRLEAKESGKPLAQR